MKKIVSLCVCIFMLVMPVFVQENESTEQTFGQDLVQGLEAYKIGNWEDALFFLKRTDNFQNALSDAVWYFVIMAEMNLGDYDAALRDGSTFLEVFSESIYVPEITYQTEYARFELDMYDEAINGFSDFIYVYPDHDFVSFAVFYTGEALYNTYDFSRAKSYFDRIVLEFPESTKYDDALFRLELLEQREREEKLLYLLRVTGEEAVAAKEDYERQIKQLQSEETLILRKRLQELETEHGKLQIERQELLAQNESLRNTVQELNTVIVENNDQTSESDSFTTNTNTINTVGEVGSSENATSISEQNSNSLIEELTRKALELQRLINEN